MTRQSILVVTRNFPPLIGGMERLMQHSVEMLASRFELTLIGPRGCGNSVPENVTVIECPATPFLFLLMSVLKGRRAVGISSFDIVLGGSGFVAPVTSFLSKVARARSAIFVHGLDLVVDNLAYQKLFLPFLRRHDLVIANSQNTRKIAMAKGCAASKIQVLNPGAVIPPDTLLRDAASLRTKFGLENNGVVLFVGRMIRRKGLAEFLEHAWPRIIASEPNARLLVVGDSPDDALRRDVRAAQKLVSLVNNYSDDTIRFMGSVSDEALWEYYALAHVLVFPLIQVKGDVEGFGMVAIEAAACGTPTVAFSQGGVTDAVADGRSGVLIAENDYQAFADAVVDVCNSGLPTPAECRTHARGFSWSVFREKLLGMLAGEL